ncbi:vWA domain-containing protein [Hymenobacter metallicola]|uniref:VWA domain-containing protein n=1 Tax=Hymenobacter metallicola TaxID=2563114 RepID=A0A4Z0QFH8_9BACT|nr:VWA domain-containing protein [Hymenobacter metallicola]TGE28216.1 VWA domain-containing protein [Hymenobacter metallicola]
MRHLGTLRWIVVLSGLLLSTTFLRAQNVPPEKPRVTRILFVLDASGSMLAPLEGTPRWSVAKDLLAKMVDSLNAYPNLELALRAYGHQHDDKENNCEDSRLEVPFAPKNAKAIKDRLKTLEARGNTPITYSLQQSANDFPADKTARNVLILITDGLESCKGDPCATSVALQRRRVFLKPFVIGLGNEKDFGKQLDCLGQYYNAADVKTFRRVLDNVITQTLTKTTVSVNLTDEAGKPVESNVNLTFVNNVTETPEYNYVHYRDAQGKPDVLDIDALQSYDLVINTVPPVRQANLPIRPGKANVLTYKTPQGVLSLQSPNISPNPYGKVQAVVRAQGNPSTVVSLNFGTKQKLLAGNYEVELLTLPRLVRRITVKQGQETAVTYEAPGTLNIVTDLKGYGSIYRLNNDESQTWVYNLPEGSSKVNLPMQPGAYRLVFRTASATGSKFTDVRNFTIRSGQTSSVSMFNK